MSLTVFVIRHGEKPGPAATGPGLDAGGQADERSLTVRGWQRAGTWAALFGGGLSPDYPRPDAIYAPATDLTADGRQPSQRSFQTVLPLAARLGQPIRAHHRQGEEAALAAEIVKMRGTVLVAWEHKRIGEALLPALLGPSLAPAAPARWNPERFDVVLRLYRPDVGQPFAAAQLFPRFLDGDSDTPM